MSDKVDEQYVQSEDILKAKQIINRSQTLE